MMTEIPNPDSAMHFRLASDADRPCLISLINAAFAMEDFFDGTRTDQERLSAMMRKGAILAAEDGAGQFLGCVYLELRGARGYLGQLAVDPARQRGGLGMKIMAAGEEYLRGQGCRGVDITVLSLRPELLPIYRRRGYIETGVEEFRPSRKLKPGVVCHAIVLSKEL
ncbi:MAG: GNAT family N-acetyltransferase [Terracidiphilus sp.]|jgi:GNAT superfamily N-acetyltransferase